MKHTLFQAKLKRGVLHRNHLWGLCLGLLLVVVLQSIVLFVKEERIVVVPAGGGQEFWVKSTKVSLSYLEEMAIFLAEFCLSTSPDSIAYQRSVVLKHAHPASYGSLKAQFIEMERLFKKQGISTSFRPVKVSVFEKDLAVEMCGDFHTWVGSKNVSVTRKTWQFTFFLERGRLFLRTFQEKEI
jgi:type IV conjugative transfer system protein TraE